MLNQIPYLNEIVSLTLMLLMVMALVAGQAGATVQDEARAEVATVDERAPFRTTIRAHFDGEPLTISIDATAEFDYFRLEDE